MRAPVHYLIAIISMSFYGGQVCPFLESLTVTQLVASFVIAIALQYSLRMWLRKIWVDSAPYEVQTGRVLGLEFFLFAGSGAALMVYNVVMYDFPFGSGLKIVLGMTSLGFFAAIDLALERQRYLVGEIIRTGNHLRVDKNYFPLSGKLGIFSVACILFILGVVFLIINKDLDWLINVGDTVTVEQAQMTILAELAFVVGIFLAHTINVIRAYTGNLRDFLSFENKILARASMGDLEGFVPVGSNDEFGTMAVYTNDMIQGMRETTDEILRTRDVSILTLASLAETRDNETGAHILRTQRYVRALALHLKQHPAFVAVLGPENNIRLLYKSAPLHDIGKVGIADAILLKPGKLSPQEMEIMKSHAALGAQSLEIAETELGSNSFLHFAREIALSHHEKWDGSGYPGGLSGADIPVSGRLMALADVYDALISKRVYKEAFSHEMARSIIVSGKGSHFDPDVVEAFLAIEVDFIRIAANFSDQAYATDEVPTTPRIKRLAGE